MISILEKKYPIDSNEFNWRTSLGYNLTASHVDGLGEKIREIRTKPIPYFNGLGGRTLTLASIWEDLGQYSENELMKAMAIDITISYMSGKIAGYVTGTRVGNPVGYMVTTGSIGTVADKVADIAKNTFTTSDAQKKEKKSSNGGNNNG